jgi:hypothetical protein
MRRSSVAGKLRTASTGPRSRTQNRNNAALHELDMIKSPRQTIADSIDCQFLDELNREL